MVRLRNVDLHRSYRNLSIAPLDFADLGSTWRGKRFQLCANAVFVMSTQGHGIVRFLDNIVATIFGCIRTSCYFIESISIQLQ